ncbi:MAG: MBOAT family O-acyltransferase [Lachnospiraceae bacterium]
MLFNSIEFAIFLPIVFTLFWLVQHEKRWMVLLVSSYYFYASWNITYLLLIVFVTMVSYLSAMGISKHQERKKWFLYLGVFISVFILFLFKYFNFISESIYFITSRFFEETQPFYISLLLPVGISFYTFQSIGYVIDVYKGEVEAEEHVGKYAAFLSFFPQLVAGPIERTKNLLPQIKMKHVFSYEQSSYGLKLISWGLFKKMVIADVLATYVDKVYSDMHAQLGFCRLIAILFFTIQIYCDFSGYSDVARGVAKLFGMELMINFKSPYFAASIKEFWQRWHISLSTWFRDYVYIPLGGNRVSKWKIRRNLMITFLVSGIWHGAAWTYIIWGGLHGGLQIVEHIWTEKFRNTELLLKKSRLIHVLKIIITFLVISILWTVFRAETIKDAAYMVLFIFSGYTTPLGYLQMGFSSLGVGIKEGIELFYMLGLLFAFDYISLKQDVFSFLSKLPLVVRWSIYLSIPIAIFFLAPATGAEFIYFDF